MARAVLLSSACGAGDRLDRNRQRRPFERGNLLWSTAGLAKTGQIRLHRLLLPNDCERFAKDPGCAGVRRNSDPVVHPFALPAGSHHARPPQICEMARNLGLALSKYLDEITDTDFPSVHEVQQPQTGAVGEGRK
jgi:hypothetical protein